MPRAAFWWAWSSWALSLATTGTALIYSAVHPLPAKLINEQGGATTGGVVVVFVVGFATVGALLAWKRPGNPIGWLFSVTALAYAAGATGLLLTHFPRTVTLASWVWLFGLGLVGFVLLLFPTGALPSSRWRPVAWAAGAGLAGWVLGNAFAPSIITAGTPPVRNPIGEALQNVAKYASATCAQVRLAATGDDLEFEVADDGAAFDQGSGGYGTGLQGMADRLSAHGGSLEVRTSPGTGTVVTGRLRGQAREAVG